MSRGLRTLGGEAKILEVGLLEGLVDPDTIMKGAVNEFGVPGKSKASNVWRIPPRPWFRTVVDGNEDEYTTWLGQEFFKALRKGDGDGNDLRAMLGKRIAKDLKASIASMQWVDNADATIKKKGFNNPLVHTGTMQSAPAYRLKSRKSRKK